MKNSATIGSVRVAASKTRRLTRPHWPPDRCCSISSASEPSVRPRQNRKPISHERTNWSTFIAAPIALDDEADAADDERPLLERGQRRRVGDDCLGSHNCVSASLRSCPRRRRPACGCIFVGSPPGTSAAAACWLSCSARM